MYRQLTLFLTIAACLVTANEVNETEIIDNIINSTILSEVPTTTLAALEDEANGTTAVESLGVTTDTTPIQSNDTTTTADDELQKETTAPSLLGQLTTAVVNETSSEHSNITTKLIVDEVNTTMAAITTTSPTTCKDVVNPKTGRSDCRRRRDLCKRAGFKEFMQSTCPLTCGYCKVCTDEPTRRGRGFCTQPNIVQMCEHRNLKTRDATRKRCPVKCGVCVEGTILKLE
ncbi:ShKT domain-containing protein [Trichostrongylus colubriformis]|uniref:ShKT domain-containing protein n=1 Tax=Trichostrongylus colubriformis TaxID=6319 RepID=A0AAN8FI92_TRICO